MEVPEPGDRVLVRPWPRPGPRKHWPKPVPGVVVRVDVPWAYVKLERFFPDERGRAGWFDLRRLITDPEPG